MTKQMQQSTLKGEVRTAFYRALRDEMVLEGRTEDMPFAGRDTYFGEYCRVNLRRNPTGRAAVISCLDTLTGDYSKVWTVADTSSGSDVSLHALPEAWQSDMHGIIQAMELRILLDDTPKLRDTVVTPLRFTVCDKTPHGATERDIRAYFSQRQERISYAMEKAMSALDKLVPADRVMLVYRVRETPWLPHAQEYVVTESVKPQDLVTKIQEYEALRNVSHPMTEVTYPYLTLIGVRMTQKQLQEFRESGVADTISVSGRCAPLCKSKTIAPKAKELYLIKK